MSLLRDDPALRVYPEHGTFSPWLVEIIRQIARNDRYLSDRTVLYPLDKMIIQTDVIWEREEV